MYGVSFLMPWAYRNQNTGHQTAHWRRFGAKQTAVMECYPALISYMTGKRVYMEYSREETQTVSSPRHEADVRVRIGATADGIIKAIWVDSLWNGGAYGDHTPTTVTLSGHKAIPLYNKLDAFRFSYTCVYTNTIASGAYRGYGATQGLFALESAVDELAAKLHMDPCVLRMKISSDKVSPCRLTSMKRH